VGEERASLRSVRRWKLGLCPRPRDFRRHGKVSKGSQKQASLGKMKILPRPEAPWRTLVRISLAGCVPAEPASVSPDTGNVA
jgi:hypothetical protein